ncbi:hypothetical protein J4E85_008592 [Alternaria conjuncta]|uniref:uncharacterized protein n=1 Tax=Alternaria conjuncta TaxID=181017 RepID=UPI00221F0D0E|nr:uncharacterized protein J4E85_008592 [Alternaria conjuncta]KAI4923553.1 hypothetical protein J4E85_008592 [Alternaria conjuncta]
MGARSDYTQGIEKSDSTDANTNANVNRNHVDPDETPPIYYDAEPSAQPPRYPDKQSTSSTEPQKGPLSRPTPSNAHRSSGAPAILGSEYTDLDAQRRADRKKKTLRERWNDFKERNFGDYDLTEDRAGAASAAEWNVQGGRLKGGMTSPYRKKGK